MFKSFFILFNYQAVPVIVQGSFIHDQIDFCTVAGFQLDEFLHLMFFLYFREYVFHGSGGLFNFIDIRGFVVNSDVKNHFNPPEYWKMYLYYLFSNYPGGFY